MFPWGYKISPDLPAIGSQEWWDECVAFWHTVYAMKARNEQIERDLAGLVAELEGER